MTTLRFCEDAGLLRAERTRPDIACVGRTASALSPPPRERQLPGCYSFRASIPAVGLRPLLDPGDTDNTAAEGDL
ncbi:hypothetical protein ACIPSA_43290 [Streptomyces sp. NPDC086549]|uniref:hypothetical protein n=1 Tax=Streptomyces sp. NPDC086549 TaxID=3365752 RepID=UPI003815A6D2